MFGFPALKKYSSLVVENDNQLTSKALAIAANSFSKSLLDAI